MSTRLQPILIALLAFALLIAQQGAALHALSHLTEPLPSQSQQDKHLPHSSACEKCVAYAGIGSALAASALAIPPLIVADAQFESAAAAYLPQTSPHYRSRAPPAV